MKRGDYVIIIVIAVTALVALGIIYLRSPDPARIVIQVDGEEKYSFPYRQEGRDEYVDVLGVNGVTRVHLRDGQVSIVESACPDKTCVARGWSKRPSKQLICLPNRVIVKIVGVEEEADIDLY